MDIQFKLTTDFVIIWYQAMIGAFGGRIMANLIERNTRPARMRVDRV